MPAGKSANALFCGLACRDADYGKLAKKLLLEAKAKRPACQHCGGRVPAGKRIDALFCSRACKTEDYLNLTKEQVLEAKANRPPCQHCGEAIPTEAQGRRVFCNKHCQKLGIYHRKKLARGRICVICHGAYLAADDSQKTCSLKCSLETKRLPDPIDCKQCCARIPSPLPKQVFCGKGCAIKWHNRTGRRARSAEASAKDPPHYGNSP